MDLAAIEAECGRLLNDPNNQRWSPAVITTRANEAQTIINGYSNAVKTKETLTPVAGTATVSLNSNTMDITRVVVTKQNGDKWPLDGMTRIDLDFSYPNWQQWMNGEPKVFWYDATNNQINLVPAPDATNAITNGLEVWEVRKPTNLAASTDIPFDSTTTMIPYHLAIVHWVVAQCWMDDGTPEALAKSRFHKSGVLSANGAGEFEKHLMRLIARFDTPEIIPTSIKYRPQGGRVGSDNPTKEFPLG